MEKGKNGLMDVQNDTTAILYNEPGQ